MKKKLQKFRKHYSDTRAFFDKSALEKGGYYESKDKKNLKHNPWQAKIRKITFELFGNLQIKSALDIGCGNGDFIQKLAKKYPGTKFKGVDFSPKVIEIARKNKLANLTFETDDILSIRPKNQFDVTICLNTLHHIHHEDLKKALENIAGLSGKFIILEVKNKKNFYYGIIRNYKKLSIDVYPADPQEISKIMADEGFYLKKIVPIFNFQFLSPLIVMLFSRKK